MLVILWVNFLIVLVEVGVIKNKFVFLVNLMWLILLGLIFIMIFVCIGFLESDCKVSGVMNVVLFLVIKIFIL